MIDFLGVTENFSTIANTSLSMRWMFSSGRESVNLDNVSIAGAIVTNAGNREISVEKSALPDEGNILLVTIPELPEGRWSYEISATSDDGTRRRIISGWIGVIRSALPVSDQSTHADRTLLVRLPESSAGKIKLEWLASTVAAAAAQEAIQAANRAEASADGIESAKDEAQESATHASESARLAKVSEENAEAAEKRAGESKTSAGVSATQSGDYATSAQTHATTAKTKATEAAGSATSAASSATTSAASAIQARQSAISAEESALEAQTEVAKIGDSVAEAEAAATQAKASATTAGTKATQAATSATNAATSETKAKASETAAGTSATNAAGSATTAAGHASTASTNAAEAGTSATQAANSAIEADADRVAAEAASGRAHTASKNSDASATQAGTARDAAVTAKIAAEAAADRAEAASGGGVTDAQVNIKINTHNTSAAAHSTEMAKKLDNPTGGTTGQVLTKTTTGTAWGDIAGGSTFDDYFTTEGSNSGWVILRPKITEGTFCISHENGGIDILSNGRIYINSYSSSLQLGGNSVSISTSSGEVFSASAENTTIKAKTTLTFVDSSGSVTLGDFVRVGDVYFHESTDSQGGANLSNWADDMLPAGWYKVEVMLFSPTDVTISALILNSTGMSGRIKSVQSIMYGGSNVNSGVPYCYYYTSSMWSGGSGSKICRIAQLNFLYKHVPANKIDWMLISDLVKFYGGSVRYTPVNLPSEI